MKAAYSVVSAVLMLLIITLITAEVFMYGIPLIKKKVEIASLDNLENKLKNTADEMEYIAQNGGELEVNLPNLKINGVAVSKLSRYLDNYYISIEFPTIAPYYSSSYISLNDNLNLFSGSNIVEGIYKENRMIVLAAESKKVGDIYLTKLVLFPRSVRDGNTIYKIIILPYPGLNIQKSLPNKLKFRKANEIIENINGLTYITYYLEVGFE